MKTEIVWGQLRRQHSTLEAATFKTYRSTRDIKTRDRLAAANDGLALEIAHRWQQLCDVDFDDLAQVARIGLLKAIERFDPGTGNAFSSFAVPYIQGEIGHFLRDHAWDMVKIPRRQIELGSKVRQVQRRLLNSGRAAVDEAKIAASLGVSASRWQQTSEAIARKPIVTLEDAPYLAAAEADEDEQQREEVRRELARLPDPYRYCLIEHYLSGMTDAAIAAAHQATTEQVHQWIEEGLKRIKTQLERRVG